MVEWKPFGTSPKSERLEKQLLYDWPEIAIPWKMLNL